MTKTTDRTVRTDKMFRWAMRAAMISCSVIVVALVASQTSAQDVSRRVVSYQIVDAREIPASLTGQQGDAEAGRRLYFDRNQTGCSGCHGSPGGPGAEADADSSGAPGLSDLSARMPEGTIRLWLVAPYVLSDDTQMPTYYAVGQRNDPEDPRYGEPLLSAGEIEDLVAYLLKN
ncbi:MAG: cytochrome c [Pseudomonadota bacterium]